jgi:hypothetical protein
MSLRLRGTVERLTESFDGQSVTTSIHSFKGVLDLDS